MALVVGTILSVEAPPEANPEHDPVGPRRHFTILIAIDDGRVMECNVNVLSYDTRDSKVCLRVSPDSPPIPSMVAGKYNLHKLLCYESLFDLSELKPVDTESLLVSALVSTCTPGSTIQVYGQPYAGDAASDNRDGIHDVHKSKPYRTTNDGALFVRNDSGTNWTALYFAFDSQLINDN